MLTFANKYGSNIYSQNGEDGIIAECLLRMKLWHGTCVEFGGADGYYCSNTRNLIKSGWTGYMYDLKPVYDGEGSFPIVQKKEITVENINDLPECNVLSIDTDGKDLELWQAYRGRPDIVVIEINSSLPPDRDYYNPISGSSYKLMVELGINKGYFLLCHTGNCIFLLHKYRRLFPEIIGDGLNNWQEYFNKSWQ